MKTIVITDPTVAKALRAQANETSRYTGTLESSKIQLPPMWRRVEDGEVGIVTRLYQLPTDVTEYTVTLTSTGHVPPEYASYEFIVSCGKGKNKQETKITIEITDRMDNDTVTYLPITGDVITAFSLTELTYLLKSLTIRT